MEIKYRGIVYIYIHIYIYIHVHMYMYICICIHILYWDCVCSNHFGGPSPIKVHPHFDGPSASGKSVDQRNESIAPRKRGSHYPERWRIRFPESDSSVTTMAVWVLGSSGGSMSSSDSVEVCLKGRSERARFTLARSKATHLGRSEGRWQLP